MIGIFTLRNLRLAGIGAGRLDCVHYRFRTRVHEADLVEVGRASTEQFCECELGLAAKRVSGATINLAHRSVDDIRMSMTVDHRRVIVIQVEELVSIDIGNVLTLRLPHVNRVGSDANRAA